MRIKQNSIYQGDCLKIMPHIKDKSIDLILCDLPYGITSCKWDSQIPLEPLWKEYKRIRKDGCPIVLFGAQPFTAKLIMSNVKEYKYDWIWYKSQPTGFANAKYKPMTNHEYISVFGKGKLIFNPIKEERAPGKTGIHVRGNPSKSNTQGNMKIAAGRFDCGKLRCPTTVKQFNSVNNAYGRCHPTQKPVDLLEYLIKTHSNPEALILDNAAGSGSTGVACQNTKRKFILIELDPEYCEIACERLKLNKIETIYGEKSLDKNVIRSDNIKV